MNFRINSFSHVKKASLPLRSFPQVLQLEQVQDQAAELSVRIMKVRRVHLFSRTCIGFCYEQRLHRMEVATMMSTTGFDFHILKPQPSCVYVVYRIQKWPNLDESRV